MGKSEKTRRAVVTELLIGPVQRPPGVGTMRKKWTPEKYSLMVECRNLTEWFDLFLPFEDRTEAEAALSHVARITFFEWMMQFKKAKLTRLYKACIVYYYRRT